MRQVAPKSERYPEGLFKPVPIEEWLEILAAELRCLRLQPMAIEAQGLATPQALRILRMFKDGEAATTQLWRAIGGPPEEQREGNDNVVPTET
jgi:hypothetical protein